MPYKCLVTTTTHVALDFEYIIPQCGKAYLLSFKSICILAVTGFPI